MKNIIRMNLEKKVNTLTENKLYMIAAPTGYGKTTLVNKISRDSDVFKLNITREYNSTIKLCRKICLDMFGADTYNQMKLIGKKLESENFLVALICVEAVRRGKLVLVLDNYEEIESIDVNSFLLRVVEKIPLQVNFCLIISTNKIPNNNMMNYFDSNPDGLIGVDDLKFENQDIKSYIECNSLKLMENDIDEMEKLSMGWPIGIEYLSKAFSGNDDAWEELYEYIEKNVLTEFSDEMKEFIQCGACIDIIPSGIFEYINQPGALRKEFGVLSRNKCFVYKTNVGFVIHPLLKRYLQVCKTKKNEEYSASIFSYFKDKKEYDQLFYLYDAFEMKKETKEMAIYLAKTHFVERNRNKYFELLKKLPNEVIYNESLLSINFARYSGDSLSPAKKNQYYDRGLALYLEDDSLSDETKEQIQNEITVFKALSNTSNYNEMYNILKNVDTKKLVGNGTFFTPEYFRMNSPMALFVYYKAGKYGELLSNINEIEKSLKNYKYGNCDGLSCLCQAEMQYFKGNLKEAEGLLNQSLELCEKSNQFSVKLACYNLQVRIYQYENNRYLAQRGLASIDYMIKRKVDDQRYVYDTSKLWFHIREGTVTKDTLLRSYTDMNIAGYKNSYTDLFVAQYFYLKGDFEKGVETSKKILEKNAQLGRDLIVAMSYMSISKGYFLLKDYDKSLDNLLKAIEITSVDDLNMLYLDEIKLINEMFKVFGNKIPKTWKLKIMNLETKYITNSVPVMKRNKYSLSKREQEVIELIKLGLKNTEIAVELGIKPDTVKEYIHNIFVKLGVSNRLEAVMKYKE